MQVLSFCTMLEPPSLERFTYMYLYPTAGFFEYWFLGIHNRINAELNVIVLDGISLLGGPGAHISEFSNIECGGSYKMSENAAILQKCQFTIEELTITRGILLTFTGKNSTA